MANIVQFPEKVSGKWIYLERAKNSPGVSVLMRCKFSYSADLGEDPVLLICANTFYQLFVNGRLAAVGPRTHQKNGISYIDAHELGFFLENGNNLIALHVYHCPDPQRGDSSRVPGMWCQLQCGGHTLMKSDESWQLMALEHYDQPRCKVAENGRMSFFCDNRQLPEKWNRMDHECDERWQAPDMMLSPGDAGCGTELHPVAPAMIAGEPLEFEAGTRGKRTKTPEFSCCLFNDMESDTGAGVSYVFCEDPTEFTVKLYSDHPFKFFCNKRLLFDGARARGEQVVIPLESGWNRLTLFAKLFKNSMGIMAAADEWPEALRFLSDMMDSAVPGWCVAPVKRLRYEECTSAVRIECLPGLKGCLAAENAVSDIWDLLEMSEFTGSSSEEEMFAEGDVRLFQLPRQHYGFAKLVFEAHEGDIVDMIIGVGCGSGRIWPYCANGSDRETVSCICREGYNELTNPVPVDCRCVLVHIRKAAVGIRLGTLTFDELGRNTVRDSFFNCSDAFFNELWQEGREVLNRSSVAITPADGCGRHDAFLLDAFLEAVNVAAVFGDDGYIGARLRQFAGSQLENGAIVTLSSGKGYENALVHMFFFPAWILYNYRFSSNMVELRSLMPKLDAARKYLTSLLDDEEMLLDMQALPPESPYSDPVVGCRLPVVLNALFCRFMITSSEIYELVDRSFDARECRRCFRKVSRSIEAEFFDEEVGLFANAPLADDRDTEFSLLGNFFPLLAGIKTAECFEKMFKTFFDPRSIAARTFEAESPYFNYFFTEMLFALGYKEQGVQYLTNYWKERFDREKNWWKNPLNGVIKTSCFAGGSSYVPNVFLIRELVGVRIAEPSHSLIYFDPAYEFLDYAEAALPTVSGRIHVKWNKQPDGSLEVNIYASHPTKVMPQMPLEMLKKSLFRLSDSVTLVKSAELEKNEDEEVE